MVEFCCCCVPIRLGTIILAAILLVSSALNAYVILGRSDLWGHQIDGGLRVFFGVIYVVFAVISFLGIIGSFTSSRRSVRLFSNLLWFLFAVYVVISIVQVVEMFQNKDNRIDDCIGNVTDSVNKKIDGVTNSTSNTPLVGSLANSTATGIGGSIEKNTPGFCEKSVTALIWVMTVWYIIINLVLFYFCNVASRFARQLESEYRHHKLHDRYNTRSASSRQSISRTSLATVDYKPNSGKGKS